MLDLIWLIPALPLAGFLVLLVVGRRLGDPRAGYLATAMVAGSFLVSVGVFLELLGLPSEERHEVQRLFTWVPIGDVSVDLAFLADPLSLTMCLFVTGIGTLIHLYATGYMHGDPRYSKFFLYLNLFAFSMLMLVLGSNLLVTFLGWEGVGACSYFLISFWHERDSAATAGKKAFVTNRVGDWGLMMAMFFALWSLGSLDYLHISESATALSTTTATAIALFAFIGACGKSAQLPLYLWLPDAMEGPTPVSALIHAATMVTAGVFLMVRLNPVLAVAADYASWVIAVVGLATALFAATIAVAQNDIKKVLAYSTVSQLGFMFLAVGSGAYVAAVFHMVTHAFFKALLFLGSGSVIHGMHHEQDMRRMGALRIAMPVTAGTFIVGWLAIAGVPPFAGFWSKDEILLFAYDKSPVLYAFGLVAAILTAYYMTRQVVMVFFGEARWHDAHDEHGAHGDFTPHESPRVMLIPLVVLAGLSIVGGAMQLPFSKSLHRLEHWLEPVVERGEHHLTDSAKDIKYLLMAAAIVVALAGVAAGLAVYAARRFRAVEPCVLAEGWYYDRAVTSFMGGPGRKAFDGITALDARAVDGAVNGTGRLVQQIGSQVRRLQTGNMRTYAAAIAVGVVVLLAWFVVLRGVL
ncbi:MAG: NADH-quinone oxidoreductase subunit [Actinomycetota bacterium]